jgi:hypothetical protein
MRHRGQLGINRARRRSAGVSRSSALHGRALSSWAVYCNNACIMASLVQGAKRSGYGHLTSALLERLAST